MNSEPTQKNTVIRIQELTTYLDRQLIFKDVNLDIYQYEIFGIAGASGSGKTTLLRNILMLLKPTQGSITVFDTDVTRCGEKKLARIQRHWGVLFQQNALFSSLTVLENVLFPLRRLTDIDPQFQRKIASLKIALTGLPLSAANKYPSELSGGMQKRAALARAIALDPEILFLDEPTAGLDPQSADGIDDLILDLSKTLNLTIIIVTHDLDSLWRITDRVAFIGEKRVITVRPMPELIKDQHKTIKEYFSGKRAERVRAFLTQEKKIKDSKG